MFYIFIWPSHIRQNITKNLFFIHLEVKSKLKHNENKNDNIYKSEAQEIITLKLLSKVSSFQNLINKILGSSNIYLT